VPPDQAPYYTAGRGGPGVYLVNTYNLPARALYSLPALTLHESAPGHAFQMPVALEQKGVPPFRRAYISAFGEGWALYTERLAREGGESAGCEVRYPGVSRYRAATGLGAAAGAGGADRPLHRGGGKSPYPKEG
jgi:hypothetical protein